MAEGAAEGAVALTGAAAPHSSCRSCPGNEAAPDPHSAIADVCSRGSSLSLCSQKSRNEIELSKSRTSSTTWISAAANRTWRQDRGPWRGYLAVGSLGHPKTLGERGGATVSLEPWAKRAQRQTDRQWASVGDEKPKRAWGGAWMAGEGAWQMEKEDAANKHGGNCEEGGRRMWFHTVHTLHLSTCCLL